jgi:hypothetical protein
VNERDWSSERQGSRAAVFSFGPDQRCHGPWTSVAPSRHLTEIIEFFERLFRPASATKQFSCPTKPFPAFRADVRKYRMVINPTTKTAGSAGSENRR